MGDVLHSAIACAVRDKNLYSYVKGFNPPNFSVPARLIEFDYWPRDYTNSGKATVYGFDYYKPGRWYQFMKAEELD